MADHPDDILRDADIARLQSEFAHAPSHARRALFDHLEKKRGGQPGIKRGPRLHQARHGASTRPRCGSGSGCRCHRPSRCHHPTVDPRRGPRLLVGADQADPAGRPSSSGPAIDEACERADPPHTYRAVSRHFVTLDGTIGTTPSTCASSSTASACPLARDRTENRTDIATYPVRIIVRVSGPVSVLPPSCTLGPMSYYTVYLEGEDAERLRELAQAARRRPRSQAEILLEDAIRRAGPTVTARSQPWSRPSRPRARSASAAPSRPRPGSSKSLVLQARGEAWLQAATRLRDATTPTEARTALPVDDRPTAA